MGLCFWKGSRWQSFNFNFADKRVNDKDLLAVWRFFFFLIFFWQKWKNKKGNILGIQFSLLAVEMTESHNSNSNNGKK